MKHFISFIIPCYNGERWIGEAIDSIFVQGLNNSEFEIVVTDDASTDGSVKVLEQYKKKYSNLIVICHEKNKGVYGGGEASNTCVRNSKGDLIFRLCQDNYLPSNTIPKLISILDEYKCDIVCPERCKFFRGEKDRSGKYEHGFKGDYIYSQVGMVFDITAVLSHPTQPTHSGNYLYTRRSFDLAGGYPDVIVECFGFGLRQCAYGAKIRVALGTSYWHRLHEDSAWRTNSKDFANEKAIAQCLREFPKLFNSTQLAYLNSDSNFEKITQKIHQGFLVPVAPKTYFK